MVSSQNYLGGGGWKVSNSLHDSKGEKNKVQSAFLFSKVKSWSLIQYVQDFAVHSKFGFFFASLPDPTL